MSLVLDASVTIARLHPKENTSAILELFTHVADDGAWAPPLWQVEVANVLQMQVRKGRYGVELRDRYLRDVASFNVTIDAASADYIWSDTIDLAHRHALTVYDAVYLELAIRRQTSLATLDGALRVAAGRERIAVLPITISLL